LTFLEPMRANMLANRRRVPPRGIDGGADGAAGRDWVERSDGSVEMLTATDSADMLPGDRFVIETPGGGGFGTSSSSPAFAGEVAARSADGGAPPPHFMRSPSPRNRGEDA
ncbi:MAG TPA: hydantoinase B/oxoprolinase family protein, partial [Sphingomicrobium sp.]